MRVGIIGLPKSAYVAETAVHEAVTEGLEVSLFASEEVPLWLEPVIDGATVHYVRTNLSDVDRLAQAVCGERCELVASLTEFQMLTASRVRTCLGLTGQGPDIEQAVVDKFATRKRLGDAGLTSVRFALAQGKDDLFSTLRRIGLPAIVKPRNLTGSIGVHFVGDFGDVPIIVHRYARHPMISSAEFLVESFVEGPEISVEGLVVGGTLGIFALTDKRTTERPYFIEVGHTLPGMHEVSRQKVSNYLNKVIAIMNIDTAPIHAELRLTRDGPELIELHTRYGGDQITRLLAIAFGYRVFAAYFRALARGEHPICRSTPDCIASVEFFGCGPGLFHQLQLPTWLLSSPWLVHAGSDVAPETFVQCDILPIERVGHVIFRSDSHVSAQKMVEELRRSVHIEWSAVGTSS